MMKDNVGLCIFFALVLTFACLLEDVASFPMQEANEAPPVPPNSESSLKDPAPFIPASNLDER